MKKISKLRRSAFASPLLLVLALFAIGTTFSVASATTKTELSVEQRSAQIAEGKNIFLKGCSSCHGLNLEGSAIAPSLIGVGAATVDFQVGTGRMPVADLSQQIVRKKPVYNAEQTAALAAYVASTAPGPAIPGEELLNYERDGNTAEGGTLFRTNCAMCHNFAGQGGALTQGKYAPTLMGVEPKYIYEAMITGPQAMPVFADSTLSVEDKQHIIAYVTELQKNESPGGFSLGRQGPVTEGLFIFVVGLGVLIVAAVWIGAKAK